MARLSKRSISLFLFPLLALLLILIDPVKENPSVTRMMAVVLLMAGWWITEVIPVAVASSLAFMLPIATPPNAIVFGSGHLKIRDMILPGFILNISGIIIVSIIMYFWGTIIFEIDLTQFPDWAVRH